MSFDAYERRLRQLAAVAEPGKAELGGPGVALSFSHDGCTLELAISDHGVFEIVHAGQRLVITPSTRTIARGS